MYITFYIRNKIVGLLFESGVNFQELILKLIIAKVKRMLLVGSLEVTLTRTLDACLLLSRIYYTEIVIFRLEFGKKSVLLQLHNYSDSTVFLKQKYSPRATPKVVYWEKDLNNCLLNVY